MVRQLNGDGGGRFFVTGCGEYFGYMVNSHKGSGCGYSIAFTTGSGRGNGKYKHGQGMMCYTEGCGEGNGFDLFPYILIKY